MTRDGGPPALLLVDSDRSRRARLAELMGERGWHASEAATVGEGLASLTRFPAAVVVVAERLIDGAALDLLSGLPLRHRPYVVVHGKEQLAPQLPLPGGIDAYLPSACLERELPALLGGLGASSLRARLAAVERGVHAALYYQHRADLLEPLAAYFGAGLALGERCVLASEDKIACDQARVAFERAGLPVTSAERGGSLLFLTHDECYFVGGRFEPVAMLQLLRDSVASALDDGFAGLRGAGEGSWLPSTPEDERAWLWYENQVNSLFANGTLTALCMYSLERFSRSTLIGALDHHNAIIDGRALLPSLGQADRDRSGWRLPIETVLRAGTA